VDREVGGRHLPRAEQGHDAGADPAHQQAAADEFDDRGVEERPLAHLHRVDPGPAGPDLVRSGGGADQAEEGAEAVAGEEQPDDDAEEREDVRAEVVEPADEPFRRCGGGHGAPRSDQHRAGTSELIVTRGGLPPATFPPVRGDFTSP
jgi:hypothetical protein